ncbi:MAG: branched-chain amino acid ABC transporter permease [Gammaproteobacteria bacterium]
MYYRETGRIVESFEEDRRMLPVREDRWVMWAFLIFMFTILPWFLVQIGEEDYIFSAILIPMMVLGIASLGLNIATGYTGQLSLGSAGFMCFGAFTAFNLLFRLDWMNVWLAFLLSGVVAGLVGIIFGLPSLRIKGFYLLVSTLCAQFFAEWFFNAYPWFLNNSTSGVAALPPFHYRFLPYQQEIFDFFGITRDYNDYLFRYFIALIVTVLLILAAKNMVRSSTGRNWMAVRDMDIAANVIGIPVGKTKLNAFFVSCFYSGIAGAMYCYCYIGNLDFMIFNLRRSFLIMFMVILGGLGSILGSFLGAIFVYFWPIFITLIGDKVFGGAFDTAFVENNSKIIVGTIIVLLLIYQPMGFAGLWNATKHRLRIWPFAQ